MSAEAPPASATVARAPARPALQFADIDAVIADVRNLQRNGYARAGKWSLAHVCWHVSQPIERYLVAPKEPVATPEQVAKRQAFLERIRQPGGSSLNPAPPQMTPAESLGDEEVEKFVASLIKLRDCTLPQVEMGPLGATPLAEFSEAHRLHAAHHLGFLRPNVTRRSGLRFASEQEVADDVARLRRGYKQVGNWTLPQVCFHLEQAMIMRMAPGPFPPDTDEQRARRPIVDRVLATGELPAGIPVPDPMRPPASPGDEAIDSMLRTLERIARHEGVYAPHRMFGQLNEADGRHLNLIHCAHHLSFLVPA